MNIRQMTWAIVVIALLGVAVVMFVQDLRRVLNRKPIKFWFQDEIDPGDRLYPLALVRVLGQYFILFAIVLSFAGVVVFVALRH